jgi:hypothetical protein
MAGQATDFAGSHPICVVLPGGLPGRVRQPIRRRTPTRPNVEQGDSAQNASCIGSYRTGAPGDITGGGGDGDRGLRAAGLSAGREGAGAVGSGRAVAGGQAIIEPPSAAASSALTASSDSTDALDTNAARASADLTRLSAQAACARTKGSGSDNARASTGTAFRRPIAEADADVARAKPARLARRIAEPLENASQAASSSATSIRSISDGGSVPGKEAAGGNPPGLPPAPAGRAPNGTWSTVVEALRRQERRVRDRRRLPTRALVGQWFAQLRTRSARSGWARGTVRRRSPLQG